MDMRTFGERFFVVSWIAAGFFMLYWIVLGVYDHPGIQGVITGAFFGFLLTCLPLMLAQYLFLGYASPLRLFRK